ncbi:hypothetical protein G9A89_001581 [Geosiphon pyriformis]|nr:hypothetical protein G9A89_001581 [Geosiphon pyriformis]
MAQRSFQIFQVFGANTNIGKTIFSAGLLRASLYDSSQNVKRNAMKLFYLKPVQTGYPMDSDAKFVEEIVKQVKGDLNAVTLYAYKDPVSPHMATTQPPSDREVLLKTKKYISECCQKIGMDQGKLFLETAGGVNSPMMSGTVQCDFYRPLRLPIILIGDSKLGGISATISAYETLHLRGYDVASILLFKEPQYNNFSFLQNYFQEKFGINGPILEAIPPPPLPAPSTEEDLKQLNAFFVDTKSHFSHMISRLNDWHNSRFDRLEQMENLTRKHIWWPFTQHQRVKQITVIDSAYGDFMTAYERVQDEKTKNLGTETFISQEPKGETDSSGQGKMKEMFDASASWWTQGLGHGVSKLSLEASYAAGRYGHVIYPECTHEPALQLAENLLKTVGKNWASRVFYSDNGSTAIEVGLKMALKSKSIDHKFKEKRHEIKVLGISGSYHGDTIGAMNACEPNNFNKDVYWYTPKGYWFCPPTILLKNSAYHLSVPHAYGFDEKVSFPTLGSIFSDERERNSKLAEVYRFHISNTLKYLNDKQNQFGALIIEPVIMGAAGMIFVDPLFQRLLIDHVREWDPPLPVIFDEVFTGFWRFGVLSAAELLERTPDIAAYAKLLTGGLLPLAVTLTTESIFEKFSSPEKTDALLHGHSYTAHPIGCWVANTSINEYEKMNELIKCSPFNNGSVWDKKTVECISNLPIVKGVISLGVLLAITLEDLNSQGYASNEAQKIVQKLRSLGSSTASRDSPSNFGILARPLGNVVYVIASQISTRESLDRIEKLLIECFENESLKRS